MTGEHACMPRPLKPRFAFPLFWVYDTPLPTLHSAGTWSRVLCVVLLYPTTPSTGFHSSTTAARQPKQVLTYPSLCLRTTTTYYIPHSVPTKQTTKQEIFVVAQRPYSTTRCSLLMFNLVSNPCTKGITALNILHSEQITTRRRSGRTDKTRHIVKS